MVFFVLFSLFPGWPINYKPVNEYIPKTEVAEAADFSMKTGYYVGGGASTTTVEGVGFQPDLVIVKSSKAETNGSVFYTSSMPAASGGFLGAALANSATAFVGTNSDGFMVGPGNDDTNQAFSTYQYIAFKDTMSRAGFTVGSYTGDGVDGKSISFGFQPDVVVVKADGATAAVWRASNMAGDVSQYFTASASGSDLIQSLDVGGFSVGTNAAVNTGGVTYYYFAFKVSAGSVAVGNYTGDGNDNRTISGAGFSPDFVWVKQNSTQAGVLRNDQLFGDLSGSFTAGAVAANKIQSFDASDGFQVGTDASVNTNAVVYYYVAFAGSPAYSPGSQSFSFKTGYYIGNGASASITGLGFKPDLVIVRAEKSNSGVFRTSIMNGDITGGFAGGTLSSSANTITSLDSDGFTIGSDTDVNDDAVLYQWVAFTGNGGTDFKVGAFVGTGVDNTAITGLGFRPDFVFLKSEYTPAAIWSSSVTSSDWSNYFTNTAGSSDLIQGLDADGFTVGSNSAANGSGRTLFYVAFKASSSKLKVGTYVGNGSDNRDITGIGFTPNFIMTKNISEASVGVMRTDKQIGDSSVGMVVDTSAANNIQGFGDGLFQVGTGTKVNKNGITYHYFAFGGASTVTRSGNFYLESGTYTGTGSAFSVTGIGFRPDMVIVKDAAANKSVYKTDFMVGDGAFNIGTAGGVSNLLAITSLDSDGFSIGTNSIVNTGGNTYYWYAFGNSGCSNFRVGVYASNGLDNRDITGVGFQPDFVFSESAGSQMGVWRTSAWVGDSSLQFSNLASTTNMIQSLASDGFQVGTGVQTNNTTEGTAHIYFAFKNTAGYFNVGKYVGNAGDNRNITDVGFQPDVVWVKSATNAGAAVHRSAEVAGDSSMYFTATANAANIVQSVSSTGFQIGTDATVNSNNVNYYWASWKTLPPDLQQISYRWRNDNGTESAATFAEAENTVIANLQKSTNKRLRFEMSNEGSSAASATYRLEYGLKETTCGAISSWTTVAADPTTEHWKIADSSYITNGENTTNVSSGLTDENTTFVSGVVLDSGPSTRSITLTPTNFTEIEYNIQATASATGGATYCFRLTNAGSTSNFTYGIYPEATLEVGAVAISITSDGVVDFGALDFSAVVSTTAASVETVRVDSGPANLSVRSTDFISGTSTWALGGSNGVDQVKLEYATSTNANWTTFSASGTVYAVDGNVAQGGTRDLRFQITMPSNSNNYAQFSSNVMIVATTP